ncbi:CLUMA_CG005978, isoform A [Clunio marinus]|uniref:CLUMA_CG005978, isoform A n=1 Tax=Clunio marinus TaxID=568069 RepID=A0A1J1HWE6_9DIPT|nr:CLUMA_CG005978, isoform A [Clunio marinus]
MGSGSEINNGGNKSGTGVYSSDGQGFCLRWNNHKSNLVEILESLIKMECYVDCTIYVDNHVQFKAHRVVLAACSPYFQLILQDAPQDHCSIIFPGVQEFEMRTLLEYIYAGEVNIAESQIPRIMKIAKMLEVKGLLDMVDLTSNISQQQHQQQQQQPITSPPSSLFRPSSNPSVSTEAKRDHLTYHHPLTHSSPIITTSTKISSAQSSSSPPYPHKSPYIASFYSQSTNNSRELLPGAPVQETSEERRSQWPPLPLPLSRSAQSMLSSVYESGSDMNPLKRKKLSSISSMLMTRDTPILRNKFKDEEPSSPFTDRSFDDEPLTGERRTSPPEFLADMRLPAAYLQQHQLQQAQYHQQHHGQGGQGSSGQKPEWKRYKQYTRNDIMSAIECVRNGMSALQASRKFGVPSRTLYDKVKKLGITTGTPRNRSSMKRESRENSGPCSSSAAFPYGSLSGAAGAFGLYPNQDNQLSQSQDFDPELEEMRNQHRANPHPASLLDPVFLQKALEARTGEDFRGDALHAMALAAAAHAQLNGIGQTSPHAHGSQSPSMLSKYINRNLGVEMNRERERERSRSNGEQTSSSIKREPVEESDEDMDTMSERAENLSLSKRESPPPVTPPLVHTPPFTTTANEQPRGVIVPPMKYSSPRSEPSSTTPPSIMEQPLALDKSEFKANLSDPSPLALTPTTTANYDE